MDHSIYNWAQIIDNGSSRSLMGQPGPDPTYVWAKWAWAKKPSAFLARPRPKYGLMDRPISPTHFSTALILSITEDVR